MNRLISTLGSLKLTVGLLVVLSVVLAAGTIVESVHGREAAALVYGAWWFRALLGVFGVNLAASLADRWPWSRYRLGFVLTHGSMLLILAGAGLTEVAKVEGRLALWEGQQTSTFAVPRADGGFDEVPLGFTLRLDDFQIDHYPGTRRPAMFRSRVTVFDSPEGAGTPAVIEMNRELAQGRYRLFQSSYQIQGGREMTVLSVSHDPGQPIVFLGYVLIVAGMLVVLATRIVQRRQGLASPAPPSPAAVSRQLPTHGVIAVKRVRRPPAGPDTSPADAADRLRTLPVQHDGRVMPLDTVAREAVWQVSGSHRLGGVDPVATALGWAFSPAEAAEAPVVRIGDRALAAEIGLPGRPLASFNELLRNMRFRELVDQGRTRARQDQPLPPLESAALDLEGRLVALHAFLTREILAVVPASPDTAAAWTTPRLGSLDDLLAVQARLAADPPAGYPSAAAMGREVLYNAVRPTRLAWLLLVPATLAAAVSWRRPRPALDGLARLGLVAGFAVMTWGIAMRWLAAGRIPASNMYESLLFMGWGVGLFALVAALLIRQRLVILNAAAMSALITLLTDLLPLDPFIHPMPPVLSGTPWLAIHVPIIMVGYALLALAALVAHMRLGLELFPGGGRPGVAAALDDAHYWYVQLGSILLLAGILTGSIWAASSWGRYWGWDPKEVWSLIAFLAYMAILHGRVDRWLGPLGVAAASVLAFGTVLMTYVGVNYVLSAGLHSYGFGGSEVAGWLLAGGVLELLYVLTCVAAWRRRTRQPVAA